MLKLIFVFFFSFLPAALGQMDPLAVRPPENTIPKHLLQLGAQFFSNYAFIADKATRTLSIWKNTKGQIKLISFHPMDSGKVPGNKSKRWDKKTPEGIYYFQKVLQGKQELDPQEYGSRAFTMDYPNHFDLLKKKTGDGIWLHSIPEEKSLNRGSRGCLVVRHEVIEKIPNFISLSQTPIIVVSQAEYVSSENHKINLTKMKTWLNNWLGSWQSRNLESYLDFYSKDLKALNMNKRQWSRYKAKLNSKYSFIQVKASEPTIYRNGNQTIIRFLQDYQSDGHADFGEKTLYLLKENAHWRIVGESWVELKRDLLAVDKKETNSVAN